MAMLARLLWSLLYIRIAYNHRKCNVEEMKKRRIGYNRVWQEGGEHSRRSPRCGTRNEQKAKMKALKDRFSLLSVCIP